MRLAVSVAITVLSYIGLITSANAQIVSCQAGLSFPAPAIDRNPLIYNTPADLRLAVSSSRIALTSNDKVQLRCRATGGKLSGTNTLPLRGADLASGLFVTNPPTDDIANGVTRRIFDPAAIYDNYSNRFWIVGSEDGAAAAFDAGRIHIAASKTSTPNSWAASQWIKCTFGAGADRNPIDVQGFGPAYEHTFPDRCSIAVDKDYLYICFREGRYVLDYSELYSVIVVVRKSSVTDLCQNPPCTAPAVEAVLRIDQGLWLATLAVDYAIDPNASPGVYVISKGPAVNGVYNSIRFGTISLVQGVWTYSAVNYTLGTFSYNAACGMVPGGLYYGDGIPEPQVDLNGTFGEFFSVVVRPDYTGIRKIWAVQTVRAAGTVCPSQDMLQWYEIPVANPGALVTNRYTLLDADHAHDPSIAVNANTDKVITFNRAFADTSRYPEVWRLTLPRGASPILSQEKVGPSVVYRGKAYGQGNVSPYWCDFSGTEPDPVHDCQFWSHRLTVYDNGTGPLGVSDKWQSSLFRFRVGCPTFALHGNLDMDQDGELTADDIAIYKSLAEAGDPEMDRTYEGETDAWDFLDFLNEWNDPN